MEIEVCERTGDHTFVTVDDGTGNAVQERRPVYHAQIKDQPVICGSGSSPMAAIGDLITAHPETFGIKVVDLGKLSR